MNDEQEKQNMGVLTNGCGCEKSGKFGKVRR